jgi:acyl-CoA synthetase (NDP forming)
VRIALLSSSIVSELERELPNYCAVNETIVDVSESATSEDYEKTLTILAARPEAHVLMPFFVFQLALLDEDI